MAQFYSDPQEAFDAAADQEGMAIVYVDDWAEGVAYVYERGDLIPGYHRSYDAPWPEEGESRLLKTTICMTPADAKRYARPGHTVTIHQDRGFAWSYAVVRTNGTPLYFEEMTTANKAVQLYHAAREWIARPFAAVGLI